jgi:chemotaxis protein CheC
MSDLTELELDALTELVNLGVSTAALGLREMVQEEVLLSVPRVSVVTRDEAIANLSRDGANRLVAVHQNFDGDIRGRALLIFPEAQSMELVRAVVGGSHSLEDLMELEQEALGETGNVLLNGCLATIANNLERNLRISLPEIVYGDGSDFFNLTPRPSVEDRSNIHGYLAMLLDLPSLVSLKHLLVAFIDRTRGVSS